MAKGRNTWTRRVVLLAAITLYAALLAADIAPNPFPSLWEWVNRDRPIAPDLVWQKRLGGRPASAAVAGDTIAVSADSRAEIRDRDSGDLLPPALGPDEEPGWPADWVLVAGEGPGRVVITSEGGGYEVRDPATGDQLHVDEDAVAVWTFQDARLDLRCGGRACQLRAYTPRGGQPAWIADLPGRRRGMLGPNPALAGGREPDSGRIDRATAGLAPLPQVLGFPVETRDSRNAVVVVATATGQVLQVLEPGDDERVMVVGDRVVRSVVTRNHGVCRATATGFDPATGTAVWGPRPYHVWTSGLGCEQQDPPRHAGSALSVVGAEGQPMVLDAYDGRVLWVGDPAEDVLALSPDLALIRDPDSMLYAVQLGGDQEPLWTRPAGPDAEAMITSCGVMVAERDPSRVYVWEARTGDVRLSVPTNAQVLACAPDGVVLASGRSLGFAAFTDVASPVPVEGK